MHIKQFEQLCRQLAEQAAEIPEGEPEAGWQQLASRLDYNLPAPASSAFLIRQCVDLPSPHGCLLDGETGAPVWPPVT